jgi:hypothetical protein
MTTVLKFLNKKIPRNVLNLLRVGSEVECGFCEIGTEHLNA